MKRVAPPRSSPVCRLRAQGDVPTPPASTSRAIRWSAPRWSDGWRSRKRGRVNAWVRCFSPMRCGVPMPARQQWVRRYWWWMPSVSVPLPFMKEMDSCACRTRSGCCCRCTRSSPCGTISDVADILMHKWPVGSGRKHLPHVATSANAGSFRRVREPTLSRSYRLRWRQQNISIRLEDCPAGYRCRIGGGPQIVPNTQLVLPWC